jgi:hypothetical protein
MAFGGVNFCYYFERELSTIRVYIHEATELQPRLIQLQFLILADFAPDFSVN